MIFLFLLPIIEDPYLCLQVREWILNDEIGDIRHVNCRLSQPPNSIYLSRTYNWRTDLKVATGGYFNDLESHGIDLFIYFLGEIQKVSGISLSRDCILQRMRYRAAGCIKEG